MRLNETLGELTGNNFDEYGEWQYHIASWGSHPRPSHGDGSSTAT
jgi:hypothetical protein